MKEEQDQCTTAHIELDDSENGLVFVDKYIPEELLAEILFYVNCESLLKCQLVCKQWCVLIQSYVWRKKAESTINRLLPPRKNIPWTVYYLICKKNPFEKNLVRNHSGTAGFARGWTILANGGNGWMREHPPLGVPPLPESEPIFNGKQVCFVTSYRYCTKVQIVSLEDNGLPSVLMDSLQPPIMASEWYSGRFDSPSEYQLCVKLLKDDKEVIDEFNFRDVLENEKQGTWLHVSHVFKNYGPGIKKIAFYHTGKDRCFYNGFYGSKMAGACICVQLPEEQHSNS